MRLFGLDVNRPRVGQWVAALGFVSALLGATLPFLIWSDRDPPERYIGIRSVLLFGEVWGLAVLAVVAVSLLAALVGATIISLAGATVVLGSLCTVALPVENFFEQLVPGAVGYGLGFYVMVVGAALAAFGSAVDLRERAR